MKKLVFALLLMLPGLFGQQWSIGYWTPWGNPAVPISGIQWDGLTHIVQWGALVRPDGTLDLTTNNFSANAPALIAAAHGANVKVLVGLTQPYWQGQTTNFQQASTTNKTAFVNNVMNLVNSYGFDGVDIDWEPFSAGTNGSAMSALIASLRAQLGARILTTAAIVTDYGYWGSVASQLDRVNVMTYDMSGLWDPYSWHNAAINADSNQVWSVDLAVQRYTSGGVPIAKLGIGIPFYGWQWKGGGITGPRQVWTSNPSMSQVAYHNFDTQITSQNYRWDSTAQVPYLTNNSGTPSFLSYDNEQSVAAKVNYAKSRGLGGWIIWALDQDYFPDRTPSHPLMNAIRNAMGVAQTPPSITSVSPLPAATEGVLYSQTMATTGSTPITWSVTGGALPAGISIGGSTGILSGTPAAAGTFSAILTATNGAGSNSKQFSLTVQPPAASAPTITTNSTLPAGNVGTSYSLNLSATGTNPINWSVTAGALPEGLALSASTGSISGTPTAVGTASFTVLASNSVGSNSRTFSLTVNSQPSGAQLWSVGYWTNSGSTPLPVSNIDWKALTHIVHFAALVNADGTLDLSTYGVSANAPSLISAAHSAGVKVLLAVSQPFGQGSAGNFYLAAANSRTALVSNVLSVVNSYGFDGVDVYWQPFSTGANSSALSAFGTDLRSALGSRIMTTAAIVTDSAFWGTEHTKYDRINVRTFDLTGTWNPYSWHNAALYDGDGKVWSIDLAVNRFKQNGVPAAKLGIGIPFFGYQWTGGGVTAPVQVWNSTPALQSLPYQSFAAQVGSPGVVRDSLSQVPYLSNNAGNPSFLTFDDAQSVAAKVGYAKSNSLGGWIIWPLEGDYLPTSSPRQPLLESIKNAMGTGTLVAPTISTVNPLPSGRVGNPYSQTLTASGTAPITWSMSNGVLPAGISLSASTGLLSGTPTTAGTYSFTLLASNQAGSSSKQFSLTIDPAATSEPLSVEILTPVSGNVTAPVLITVATSSSVSYVEYRLNGEFIARVNKAPFSYSWDASGVSKKSTYYLYAVAFDANGNSAMSGRVRLRFR